MIRWQLPVLKEVRAHIDGGAIGGSAIKALGLPPPLFDSRPEAHVGAVGTQLAELYGALLDIARREGRLRRGQPLCERWTLTYDIYSPKLKCFIEVDERQHFSKPRLDWIQRTPRPIYPTYFWEEALPGLVRAPARDRDPAHRDEQRAYRDACRDLLPIVYGFGRTLRLDEFTLRYNHPAIADLLRQVVAGHEVWR